MFCIEFLKKKRNSISISNKGGSKERIFKKDFFYFYVRVSPIPQLIYTTLTWNYPIYVGPQAWICVGFKTKIFIKNQEICKPIKKWLHIILRK